MSQFILFCVLLYIMTFEVNHASGIIRQRANASLCPYILPSPSFLEEDFGKKAVFTAFVESKQEPAEDAIWQKILNNGHTADIDRSDVKYDETENFPSPKLVINKLDFNDTGYYRLQVKISDGWCTSPTNVRLRKVRGILQYNRRCNESRECDERKYLLCLLSNSQKKCLCRNYFYHRNQTCFEKSSLLATNIYSNITSSEINIEWGEPSTDSDLIQHYDISIIDNGGTTIKSASVGKHTSYRYISYYVPGHRYYFKITSNVKVSDPSETFTVEKRQALIVEPLPPGSVIRNTSIFHPEKLHLEWTPPENNTRVDRYIINIYSNAQTYAFVTYTNKGSLSNRLEPGKNYTVSIVARSYGKSSKAYKEVINTLRTPWVIITSGHWVDVPYLSNMEITATVKNMSDFPPTLETKWETNFSGFNITHSRYNGSSLDLFNPNLVINRVDFYHEEGAWFRCSARNSEGWGTSEYTSNVDVHGSLKFSEPCNYTRECLEHKYLECSSGKCLCNTYTYHKGKKCYSSSDLQARSIHIMSSTCDITITWEHPTRDRELITGYQVITSDTHIMNGNQAISSKTVSVGNITEYTTPCKLQPGKRHSIYIRSKIHLSDPPDEIIVDSERNYVILDPVKPGKLVQNLCNRSADYLYLRWEKSGKNSFVNRYRVTIDGRTQITTGYEPEIYWEVLLLPNTQYNVTITAISYGFITNYPSYGSRESLPLSFEIETTSKGT
ncbi:uncharacterized protein LOC134241081 [Saccostrea cucullata]|uniref:uncharacterized protein LOC134241081 n=1 Tax=Saccostrea cuccullata TaxID=36930 RepID=UPI002ED520B6